ncbi:competence protein ComGB [Evansella caseinilytica]|uniref:Competence protein ComGB n=1 Tax=Evansella caseinilytica TaxID=1503961 RepID=A0A1H3KTP8_9BACI|nr:competence protein ComGB [Evansella caseinilytica]
MERCEWLQHLSSLLGEGFSLSEALLLFKEFHKGAKKAWCESIYQALSNGEDFSTQLLRAGYTKDVVSYLYFVEKYGELKPGLDNAALLLKKRYELKQNIRKLLQYPVFLILCLAVIITVLSEGVFPQFQYFFSSMNQELPWFTKWMISLLSVFRLPYLFLFCVTLLFLLLWLRRKSSYQRIMLLLRIPYLRTYVQSMLSYYFSTQLSPMLLNGFSLFHALKVMEEHSKIDFFHQEAKSLSLHLQAGEPLSEVIADKEHYDRQLAAVIRMGEAKGRLGLELERYANYLFHRQFESLHRLLATLQPVIYGAIGFIVLVLFLSMMLPIFSIVDGW